MLLKNRLFGLNGGFQYLLVAALLGLVGCGGGSSDPTEPAEPTGPGSDSGDAGHTVGGTATGIAGNGPVVLELNGDAELTLEADGPFVFATSLADEQAYSVSLKAVPAGRLCSLRGDTGHIEGAAVDDVALACLADPQLAITPQEEALTLSWQPTAADRYNLCLAAEPLDGGFGNCASHASGELLQDVTSPLEIGGLDGNQAYWAQLELASGAHRLYSSTVSAQALAEDATRTAYEIAPRAHFGGTPSRPIDFDGRAVFTVGAAQLWISDGTPAGTSQIELPAGFVGANLEATAVHDGRLYFRATLEGDQGLRHILATDGTSEGTVHVVDGNLAGMAIDREMVAFGDRVAFIAYLNQQTRLALIDAQAAGGAALASGMEHIRVSDISVGPYLQALDDTLFVGAADGAERLLYAVDQQGIGSEAWRMNSNASPQVTTVPSALTVAGDRLFFRANAGDGVALWTYRSGAGVTRLIDPAEADQHLRGATNLTAVGDRVFFFTQPWDEENRRHSHGLQLAVSNGTRAGTRVFGEDAHERWFNAHHAANMHTAALGDRFVFESPSTGDHTYQWWSSQGTTASTGPLKIDGQILQTPSASAAASIIVGADEGAWLFTSGPSELVFVGQDAAYVTGPEELTGHRDLAVIGGRPWFIARIGFQGDSSLWRMGPAD